MKHKLNLAQSDLIVNAAFGWKCLIESPFKFGRYCRYRPPKVNRRTDYDGAKPRIAIIADEMTYQNFRTTCETYALSPQNWLDILEKNRPDIFFCESAWSGTREQNGCWRYHVYGRERLWFDNRKALRDILRYCRQAGIPTVFWNKEDPAHFSDCEHNFADTALLFDHVLTTDDKCFEKYKEAGCRSANVMTFGYSPKLFYPLEGEFDAGRVVFFGSWYGDYPERCRDTELLLDMVLAKGLRLEIYDRNAGSREKRFEFPEKYRGYVLPGVDYTQIRDKIGKPCYAVNINTVKDSNTMYARRVPELMACGCVIISNESVGLRKRFGKNIWFYGDDFDERRVEEIRRANIEEVQLNDTWDKRLSDLLKMALPAQYV